MGRRLLLVLLSVAAGVAVLLVIGHTLGIGRLDAADLLAFGSGVGALASLMSALRSFRSEAKHPLTLTADRLAGTVRGQLEDEVLLRSGAAAGVRLPLSWRVLRTNGQPGPVARISAGVEGLTELHRGNTGRRLVLVGAAGSGKTVLALDLARALLDQRAAGEPVPVLCALASWSGEDPLADWLADLVTDTYLIRREQAWQLVGSGLVRPILDGFDEVAPGLRARVLREIEAADFPVVLTSRPAEYFAAATDMSAVIVELEPVAPISALTYLRTMSGTDSDRWESVLTHLARRPTSPLASVLRLPLWMDVLSQSYSDAKGVPAELVDPIRFRTQEQVSAHLLDKLLEGVLTGDASAPLGLRGGRTVRWLGFFAQHLHKTGSTAIAWWSLHRAVPANLFKLVAIAVGVTGGVAATMALGPTVGFTTSAGLGAVAGIVAAVVLRRAVASSAPPHPSRIRLSRKPIILFGAASSVGVATAVVMVFYGRPWSAALAWLLTALSVGAWVALRVATRTRAGDEMVGPRQSLRQDRAYALVHGVSTALMVVVVTNAAGLLARSWPYVAVLAAVSVLLGAGSTAYYRYLVSRVWLALRGDVPWNVLAFLDNAHRGGLLRTAGGTYEFRHVQVQERLAHRFTQDAPLDPVLEQVVFRRREMLLERAFERADVRALVESGAVRQLERDIGAQILGNLKGIVAASAAARDRFVESKARYARQVSGPWLVRYAPVYGVGAGALIGFTVIGTSGASVTWVMPAVLWAALVAALPATAGLWWLGARALMGYFAPITVGARGTSDHRTPARISRLQGAIEAEKAMRRWGKVMSASAALAAALALSAMLVDVVGVVAPGFFVSADKLGLVSISAIAAVLAGLWLWSAPRRARLVALRSDDPVTWRPDNDKATSAAREDAERAHDEWINAMVEAGVLPLVGVRVAVLAKPSYETVLPELAVEKLGEITESAQFVPTATSEKLKWSLTAMSSGAIGLSGTRGIGKSTVLRMFGNRGFGADPNDLTLVIPAPTSYNSRDFLVHLFIQVCELVLPPKPAAVTTPFKDRKGLLVLVSLLGIAVVVGSLLWPTLVEAAKWGQGHVRMLVTGAGMILTVAPMVLWTTAYVRTRWRGRKRDLDMDELARRHLLGLRYLETRTHTTTGSLKPPVGIELGSSRARQHAAQAKTYPELVNDFRKFLDALSLRRRKLGARVVICIDELDKIAGVEEAERFINDIKTVFGVEGCFFLVAVSEDALASFARRALSVRTTFDSAFDNVIQVGRLSIADTRRLLVHRVLRLPEPFVWLCHTLSGGLPRDLNRIVRLMYELKTRERTDQFDELALSLVTQDLKAVTEGLLIRISGRTDDASGQLQRWLAGIRRVQLTSEGLMRHHAAGPHFNEREFDELRLLGQQYSTYLVYAATLLRAFRELTRKTIDALTDSDLDTGHPMQLLAEAREHLSADPVVAMTLLEAFHVALPVLAPPASDAFSD